MTTMKKRTALAVTGIVWLAGIGSAVALTYELGRRPRPAVVVPDPVAPIGATLISAPAQPLAEPPIIYVPTITIALHHTPTAPKQSVDISKMRCTDWRDLDMGSGQVQACD